MSDRLLHKLNDTFSFRSYCIYCGKTSTQLLKEGVLLNRFKSFEGRGNTEELRNKWINDNSCECLTYDEYIIKQIIE